MISCTNWNADTCLLKQSTIAIRSVDKSNAKIVSVIDALVMDTSTNSKCTNIMSYQILQGNRIGKNYQTTFFQFVFVGMYQ